MANAYFSKTKSNVNCVFWHNVMVARASFTTSLVGFCYHNNFYVKFSMQELCSSISLTRYNNSDSISPECS